MHVSIVTRYLYNKLKFMLSSQDTIKQDKTNQSDESASFHKIKSLNILLKLAGAHSHHCTEDRDSLSARLFFIVEE